MSDNMISVCAFCKRQSRLTQEHLFPKSLLEHKKRERKPERSMRFLAKTNKFLVDTELTIGDVCAVCNNGVLSDLDAYFNEIYKRYICNYVALGQSKRFTYDFDRLARWLLKTSYNVARVHNSPDISSLEKCVDFILHGKPKPKGLSIFLLLVTPHKVKDPMVLQPSLQIKETKPDVLRVARNDVYSPNSGKIIFRIVHINSYFFLCLVPDQESYRAAYWYRDLKGIKKLYPGIYQLRSNKKDANETSVNVKGAVDIIKMSEDYTPSVNLKDILDLIE